MSSYLARISTLVVVLLLSVGLNIASHTAEASQTNDTRAPSIPSRLNYQELQPNQVRIGWNNSIDFGGSGVKGYRVYRNYRYLGETSSTSYTDRTVEPNKTYVYGVSAFDASTRKNHSALRTLKLRTPSTTVVVSAPLTVAANTSSATTSSVATTAALNTSAVTTSTQSTISGTVSQDSSQSTASIIEQQLPLGGQFYGNIKGGMMGGNGPIAFSSAIRFRAERTGSVQAMRYNNRLLKTSDIEHRCGLYGKSSVWCACKNAGLDQRSCGYTLANSYHVGSGGLITVELRNDDGSSSHLPGNKVLAASAPYVPVNLGDKFPTIRFKSNAQLKAGELYHLVFRNDKFPTNCKLKNLSVQQAAACPRDQGAMALNGTKHATDPSSRSAFGPYLGNDGTGLLYKATANGRWLTRADVAAFYEIQYTNGDYVGDSYTGYDNPNYGSTVGTRTIEGSTKARQSFLVEDASREVDGLWLQYGHVYSRKANLKPMQVTLKGANGRTLATGTLPASKACSSIAYAAGKDGKSRIDRDDWMCRTWGYTNLSTTVSLIEGQKYTVEFSAPAGAGFDLSTYFSVHRRKSHNDWDNAKAEISLNNGSSWNNWTNSYTFRDLPVLFTILGMPKHLP